MNRTNTALPPLEDFGVAYFTKNERTPSQTKLGGEWELIGFDRTAHHRLLYTDIKQLLEEFILHSEAEPAYEGDSLIGVQFVRPPNAGATLTLEPGGQFEYSSSAAASFAVLSAELHNYITLLTQLALKRGLVFFSAGLDPISPVDAIPRLSKKRYEYMLQYLPKFGPSVKQMMLSTASFQVSLDYCNMQDWHKKLVVGQYLTPFVLALFSNSSLSNGQSGEYFSQRGQIWQTMDPARVGFIPNSFQDHYTYLDYVRFAANVPMLVVQRDQIPMDMTGQDFRQFWQGMHRLEPMPEDWSQHLRSIFTWVRAKNVLEMRAGDACSLNTNLGQAALWIGWLYDQKNLDQLFDEALQVGQQQVEHLALKVIINGPSNDWQKKPLGESLLRLVELGKAGFMRHQKLAEPSLVQMQIFEPLLQKVQAKNFHATNQSTAKMANRLTFLEVLELFQERQLAYG